MDEMEMYEEQDKQAFVQHLLDCDMISGDAANGVAKRYVDKGSDELTESQQYVLETHVIEAHRVSECERCSNDIPWSEQIEALDDGYCSYCRHMHEKVMRE